MCSFNVDSMNQKSGVVLVKIFSFAKLFLDFSLYNDKERDNYNEIDDRGNDASEQKSEMTVEHWKREYKQIPQNPHDTATENG